MSINVYYVHFIFVGLILYFLPMFQFSVTDDTTISVRIRENVQVGTIICQLSDLIIPRPNKNTDFSITKNNFFAIDDKDKLVVIGVVDRDDNVALCINKKVNFSCIWKSFLISSTGFYHILEIIIDDENDNRPKWSQPSVIVEVTENTLPDIFHLELPKAQDLDEHPNDVTFYQVDQVSKYFIILSVKSITGIKPILKLKRTVDRELISWHNITVLAIDGGSPPKTGSLLLFIKILDENDNYPVFESSIYTRHMKKNLDANTTLDLNIRATDLDIDANGKITYHFSLDIPFIIQLCFDINPINAVLRIKFSLTKECYSPEYRFNIIASDHGQPSKTAKTTVTLHLKNQNLYPPKIILSKSDPNIYILENNNAGGVLISGAVQDKDSDRNGEFDCFLRGVDVNVIYLKSNRTRIDDITIISIISHRSFDREKISKIPLTIVCQDFGDPPLQSSTDLVINILDLNDNFPKFEKEFYSLQIYEENQPNYKIAQLTATDLDYGPNALLIYSIEWDRNKYNIDELIKVESQGQVIAKQSLDREKFPNGFQFQIIATDHGKPSKSGSTMVDIELLDINDHSPFFEKFFYNFTFIEDIGLKQKRRTVGFLKAKDADLRENGLVTYSLFSESLLPFQLQSNTGELYSYILIDRETQPNNYSFSVLAIDSPSNLLFRRTTTVSVSIIIEDFNDNEPVFIFPNEANYKVQLSYLVPVGTVVTTVKALDKDSGSNSQIRFSLVDAERIILFTINQSSGEISTTTVLNSIHEGDEHLFIRATDCGTIPFTTIQRLIIVIGEFKNADQNGKVDNDINSDSFLSDQATFIIVGIILGTFFICCGLVTSICTLAYRRWNNSRNMSATRDVYQVGQELTNVQNIDNYLVMKELA